MFSPYPCGFTNYSFIFCVMTFFQDADVLQRLLGNMFSTVMCHACDKNFATKINQNGVIEQNKTGQN